MEELKPILEKLKKNKPPSQKELWDIGFELMLLAIKYGNEAIKADEIINQKIVSNIDGGEGISSAQCRAKASIEYHLKKEYEMYFNTALEAKSFIEKFK